MIPGRQNSPLVLVNVLNYGHFNSYAGTFARWGLASGLDVVLLGHEAGAAAATAGLTGQPGFSVAEIRQTCRLACPDVAWGDPAQARVALGTHCQEIVAEISRALAPFAILLVNADEVFFHNPAVEEPGFSFAAPVYGVVTFGRREAHLGIEEPYTRRLKAVVQRRGGFAGLCSIDELHMRDNDLSESFLHYLPDPYKEFHAPGPVTAPRAESELSALRKFLTAARGPITPILGKFDRRKGNLWILRAALRLPQLRVVVLGERVPDPVQDPEIDHCLELLTAQGRAFTRFGFLPQEMFDLIFASGKVPCLPLPYRSHTGSSGVQLMAHEYGVPVLVPDFGLMAERVQAHGLGEVYRPGDEADFSVRFAALLERGSAPYRKDILRFMDLFGPGPSGEALTSMLFGKGHAAGSGTGNLCRILDLRRTLPDHLQRADDARRALAARDLQGAEDSLRRALEAAPDSPGLLLTRSIVLWRLGRLPDSAEGFLRCAAAGLDEELRFLSLLAMQSVHDAFQRQAPPRSLELAESLLSVLPGLSPELPERGGDAGPDYLLPEFWQRLGGIFAQGGAHTRGATCFRKAIALEPENQEYRLNLSDVLRYADRLEEALEPLAELERLEPRAHGLAHKRGQVLLAQGKRQEAARQFALEPENSPHSPAARDCLNKLAARGGK